MENRSFLGHSRQFVIGRSLPNALSQEDKICVFLFASISNITTTKESNRFVKKDCIPNPHLLPPPPPPLSPHPHHQNSPRHQDGPICRSVHYIVISANILGGVEVMFNLRNLFNQN